MASLRLKGVRPRILEPVDLELASGELVFISGPSGSGKSLLLRAVADLDPHEGDAWLGAVARSTIPAPEWRRRVGLLPAESHWWGESVRDHFPVSALPLTRGGEGISAEGIEEGGRVEHSGRIGITNLLERLGFAPQTLDWSVGRLSTGERQRLALARLLANDPEVLLLDEATANLDASNRNRVEAIVGDYRLGRNAPVLWVSHDPDQRRRLGGRRLTIHHRRLEPEP